MESHDGLRRRRKVNNKFIGSIRFWFLNKPKHRRKCKLVRPEIPYAGPEQWLLLISNHKWRERYGNRT